MVTNYPRQLTASAQVESQEESRAEGLWSRALGRVGQAWCGLHGHDSVLHFEQNRVLLRCTSCGYNSPGWEIGQRRPRLRFEGDERRHLIGPVPLRKTA
jgi:hypothetical protein